MWWFTGFHPDYHTPLTHNDTNPSFATESNSLTNSETADLFGFKMVELVGIEPTTSSLRTMRSPS